MREELINQINKAVADELAAATKAFGHNISRHESYAVLLEEFEETRDELQRLESGIGVMWWQMIKKNADTDTVDAWLKSMHTVSVNMIAEAVQTAAMIEKFRDYLKTERSPQKPDKPKSEAHPKIDNIKSVKEIKWTPQQRAEIQAIKEAHKTARSKAKEEGKLSDEPKRGPKKRKDLDDAEIFRLKQSGMTLSQIAKKMGCCPQTVANRLKNNSKE